MRTIALMSLLVAFTAYGAELVVAPDCSSLTAAQAAWADSFARGAERGALAASAAPAGLNLVAAYLASADPKESERLWTATTDEPLIVVARPDVPDRMVGVAAVPENRWLAYLARNFENFERTLPGYQVSWRTATIPVGRFVIADLMWHSAGAFPRGTFPPFDPSLRSEIGRSHVYWRNAIEQSWFEHEILHALSAILTPNSLRALKPEALTGWYAIRFTTYRAGKEFPARRWDRYDALNIAKADVLAVLATDWLVRQKMRSADAVGDQAAIAAAMAFYAAADVIRGGAPAPHATASRVVLEFLRRKGALTLDRNTKKWSIVTRRVLPALRALASEILAAEAQGDRLVVESFLAKYEKATPEIDSAIAAVAAVTTEKPVVRYAGCAGGVGVVAGNR